GQVPRLPCKAVEYALAVTRVMGHLAASCRPMTETLTRPLYIVIPLPSVVIHHSAARVMIASHTISGHPRGPLSHLAVGMTLMPHLTLTGRASVGVSRSDRSTVGAFRGGAIPPLLPHDFIDPRLTGARGDTLGDDSDLTRLEALIATPEIHSD